MRKISEFLADPKVRLWIPTVLCAIVIFSLSCVSNVPDEVGDLPYFDKFFHLCEFSVFGFFLYRSMRGTFDKPSQHKIILWAIMVGIAYAALDEFHQFFVANRTPDIKDWIVDGFGCFIGSLVYINREDLIKKIKRQK